MKFAAPALCAIVLLLSSYTFSSYTLSRKLSDDLWKQLGISKQDGTDKIRNSFFENYFQYAGVRNLKSMAAGDRAAVAKDLLEFTKQYVNGPSFKAQHGRERLQAKPGAYTAAPAKSKEEIRKEKIAETQKSIKDLEENLKKMTPEMQKGMQPILDVQRQNLKDYQDPKSQLIESEFQSKQLQEQQNQASYNERLTHWQTAYPEDFNQLIKNRLQKYLELAASVDFSAQLVEKGGRMRFVKPTCQGKPNDWKMIYRAGPEVYKVAKPFAEQWLKELP